MSYHVHKYGVLGGQIPVTLGRIFWVSPSDTYQLLGDTYSASDNNLGLNPKQALRTLAQALTNATAANDDVILLLPGSHTVATASAAVSKSRLTIMGLPTNGLAPKTSVTTTVTADQIMNVTAADVEIANLRFIPITASAAIDFSVAADRLYIHDCHFDLYTPVASTSTLGVDALGAASYVLIERCRFDSDGAQGAGVDMTATLDSVVRDNVFATSAGTWAAALTVGAATDRLLINNCYFLDFNGTITAGVDGTGASIADGVAITNCRFGENVTVGIDNFDAGEAQISENYDFGIGATDGGILVVAIT